MYLRSTRDFDEAMPPYFTSQPKLFHPDRLSRELVQPLEASCTDESFALMFDFVTLAQSMFELGEA